MDQILMSPGSSVSSIETPVHQPEKDQQTMQMQLPQPQGLAMSTSSLPSQQQSMNEIYQTNGMGYVTPHSMMNSEMPVLQSTPSLTSNSSLSSIVPVLQTIQNPATPAPTTSMTLASADLGILPQVQNIVSTVNFGCLLDLKTIALNANNAEFNPKRLPAVIMRIREPRTTALFFGSGKMVCTGAKSEEASRLAARKYTRIIQKLGFPAQFSDFKIQNIVSSYDVEFPICLEKLVLTHGQFSSYEPELFPGIIYRMVKPDIVLLIFASGKVVLTGAKIQQDIFDAYHNIHPILKSFKKY